MRLKGSVSLTSGGFWNAVRAAETVASSTSRGAGSKEAGYCTNKSGIIISSLYFSLDPSSTRDGGSVLIVPLEDA